MRKILVFQHTAHENWGTIPLLMREKKFRVRYINFDRSPESSPSIQKYNGLIVLGGQMGVYETENYPHIRHELELIERALKNKIPILGICLGAQLLAHVLGAEIKKCKKPEIGWQEISLTREGSENPLFSHFSKTEKLFQMHKDEFTAPKSTQILASSTNCANQAFVYDAFAYGLQFHLEVDQPMIERWLNLPDHQKLLSDEVMDRIRSETFLKIDANIDLSKRVFTRYLELFSTRKRKL